MIFKDQIGNSIELKGTPERIISIVPSQTELLSDLGLDEKVMGITRYCVHPRGWLETKTVVGGTKKLNLGKIRELRPDLVIANKEENEKKQVLELINDFPVWTSDIRNLESALEMIEEVGKVTGKQKSALEIQNNIREQFSLFKLQTSGIRMDRNDVLYLIWRKPYLCAGKDTFIDHLLGVCGLQNAAPGRRYPAITAEKIVSVNPSLILLSSEPYPFREKHIAELQALCPRAKVALVDGEMFSWYGSRLLFAPSYFERLLKNL